jgi:spermidine dehydrogenase
MKPIKPSDKALGLNSNITRRDFINSTLMGVGGTLLATSIPLSLLGCEAGKGPVVAKDPWTGYGAVGDYANASGNTKAVMEAAHKVRDGLYNDPSIPVKNTDEVYDMVIVGGGMSGLGAAHYFKKNASAGQKCLILENHSIFGGEAKRNEFIVNGQRLMGPQGSNDFGVPREGSGSLTDQLFDELKIPREYKYQNWDTELKPLNFGLDNYAHMTGVAESKVDIGYFFKEGQGVSSAQWFNNIWRNDLADAPFSEAVKQDLLKWRYYNVEQRGLEFSKLLDSMTYKEYLEGVLKLSPEVTQYTDPVIGLISGAGSDAISAFAASQIGMPGVGRARGKNASSPLSFPGGNTAFARFFVKGLIPESIKGAHTFEDITNQNVDFEALDKESNQVRIRVNATVVNVAHEGNPANAELVKVMYEKDGITYQVKAKSVVMASGGWINKHIIRDLPEEIKEAYNEFTYAPALIANVALTNWRFMYKLGITAAQWFGDGFGFSCNIRKTMVIGDYNPPLHPDQPAVLTFYMGASTPGLSLQQQNMAARAKIFSTSFFDYEKQLRTQMLEQFGASGFDPEKDIAGITLNRWGHARLTQQPGFFFGKDGKPAPREVVAKGFGKIIIGHSELNGHQSWTGGVSQGFRAAEEALGKI